MILTSESALGVSGHSVFRCQCRYMRWMQNNICLSSFMCDRVVWARFLSFCKNQRHVLMAYLVILRTHISDNCRPITGHAYKTSSHPLRAFDKVVFYILLELEECFGESWLGRNGDWSRTPDSTPRCLMAKLGRLSRLFWPIFIRNSDHSAKSSFYPKFGLGLQKPLFFFLFPFSALRAFSMSSVVEIAIYYGRRK